MDSNTMGAQLEAPGAGLPRNERRFLEIGLTFMMGVASPPIMKDTMPTCCRTRAEVAKVFEGFWTAKPNSTRRHSLVPRIAWHSLFAESGQRTLKRAVRLA